MTTVQWPLTPAGGTPRGRPREVAPRHGLLEWLGPERFHPTVGTAVDAYVAETGVDWREEDSEPNADPEGR